MSCKKGIIHLVRTQAAYTCFLSDCKRKFNYYMRTISSISKLLRKADEVIQTEFIPAITGAL